MSPSTEEEIRSLIDSLNPKKVIRKLEVETKFLKFGEMLISDTLRKRFNKCIEKGINPSCQKIAEVIPVFEKDNRYMATHYVDLLLCCHNLINYLKN